MINQAGTDQLDDAVDCFEKDWSPAAPGDLRCLLEKFGLEGDPSALTELIRIDIELRYKDGLSTRLEDYFQEFESLLSEPQHVAEIAFEDFRSRSVHGHPVSGERWRDLPGVSGEIWYQQLSLRDRPSASQVTAATGLRLGPDDSHDLSQRIADAEFESALGSIGFRLIQEIGQGAFSRVYLATQNDLANRFVVLKVVQKTLAEPQCMAMLQHTNIVPIYSFHRIKSRSVICMPYAGGVTLADFLSGDAAVASRGGLSLVTTVRNRVNGTIIGTGDNKLSEGSDRISSPAADDGAVLQPLEHLNELGCNELAVWMFERLASALAHSHARGVLHGDLKPANVLIRNDGEPALLDFNLAQSLERREIKHVGGTLPYMAPECYRALMGQAITPQNGSDIYGLGVMLFEFTTGRLPYPSARSSAPVDLEPAIEVRRQSPPWSEEDNVSPGLRSIINRCLAFEAADRYTVAEHLQEDLANEHADLPLSHAAESRKNKTVKWARRHPQLISASSVGLLLLALLIPIASWAWISNQQSRVMAALARADDFSEQSARVLTSSVANPLRYSDDMIIEAIHPLDKSGLLDESRSDVFETSLMTEQRSDEYRETALRHILHVAFVELGYIRPRSDLPIATDKLQRLDRLIAAAERLQGGKPSRALDYAKAERAEMAGQSDYQSLLAQADALPIVSSTEKYLEAIRLMAKRDYGRARDILKDLADTQDQDTQNQLAIPSALRWTLLGRSQFNNEDYERAKLSFTHSLEHAPQASRLWLLRGHCFSKQIQYDNAIADFTKAIEYEPTLVGAFTNRGLCYQGKKETKKAIQDFDEALRLSPGNVHILVLRSRALRNQGNDEAADADFEMAMQGKNLNYRDHVNRSRMLRTRANALEAIDGADTQSDNRKLATEYREAALKDLDMAGKLDGEQPLVFSYKAVTLAAMGKEKEAIDNLTRYIDKRYSATAIMDRAVLLARTGDGANARKDLIDVMSKSEEKPARVRYQAACVHALLPPPMGNRERAIDLLFGALFDGYGADYLADDPDLESLRDDERFQLLVRAVRRGSDKQRGAKKTNSNSAL